MKPMVDKRKKDNKVLFSYETTYQGKWVALDSKTDEVLISNKNLQTVKEKMEKTDTQYYLEKVLPINYLFVP